MTTAQREIIEALTDRNAVDSASATVPFLVPFHLAPAMNLARKGVLNVRSGPSLFSCF